MQGRARRERMRPRDGREQEVEPARIVRIVRDGERLRAVGRHVVALHRRTVDGVAGAEVGHVAFDQATRDRVAGAGVHRDVVDHPPEAEHAREVEAQLHVALVGRLRQLGGLQVGTGNSVTAVVPDVRPRATAVGAHVHVARLWEGRVGDVVVVERHERRGPTGQVERRRDE